MQNVILAIHLILALLLIGVVLLQRSEGGGLGMGSTGAGQSNMDFRRAFHCDLDHADNLGRQ